MNHPRAIATAFFTALVLTVVLSASAQSEEPGVAAAEALVSEPGKAALVSAVEMSAEVVAIDPETRTVSLKGSEGETLEVVAGDEVQNFDQIEVGDRVVARYVEALTLALEKTDADPSEVTVTDGAARAAPGERPGVAGATEVTAIAEVVALDPEASTISLKGPQGKVTTLPVRNPVQFEVVKVGDQVRVTYTEAVALSVEPAPAEQD